MRLLITGAGRSGTWWVTMALQGFGVEARHEVAFNHRVHDMDFTHDVEVSWLAAPYTTDDLHNLHVVHLVRDPRQQIASRAAWGSFEEGWDPRRAYDPRIKGRWAMDVCPKILEGRNPVERAAIHWVEWNRMVRAREVVRIEDVTMDGYVVEWAELALGEKVPFRVPDAPDKAINAAPLAGRQSLTWEDLERYDGVMELAEEYGYLEET